MTLATRLVLGLAVAAATGLLCLVGLELAVRVLVPQPPSWLGIYRHHPTLPIHTLQANAEALVSTGETHWTAFTDAQGFRVGRSPSPAGRCNALWIGDSFAFGHGVDFEESWIGRLAERVPEVRQTNAAVPAYGPVQYRQVLEELLPRSGPIAFVYLATYVGNDFHDAVWVSEDVNVEDGILGHEGDLKSLLKTRFQLYRLASGVYHRISQGRENPYWFVLRELGDPAGWEREPLAEARQVYRDEFGRISSLVAAHGATLRVVVIPTRDAVFALEGATDATVGANPQLPVDEALAVFAEAGQPVLDATPRLAGIGADTAFFPRDGHLTPQGNAGLADAILERWPLRCP